MYMIKHINIDMAKNSSMSDNPIIMDKNSTEIISSIYSEEYFRRDPNQRDSVGTEINSDDEDSTETVVSKRNTNATTAHLSAQVMSLPYFDFDECISSDAPKIPDKIVSREIDVIKRIKDAYKECSCKVCRCLTRTTVLPLAENCDCEPCNCKDCVGMRNRHLFGSGSISENKYNSILNYTNCRMTNTTECKCKPCECTECSKHFNPLSYLRKYKVQKNIVDIDSSTLATETNSQQEFARMKAKIERDMDAALNMNLHDLAGPLVPNKIISTSSELDECDNPFCSHKQWIDKAPEPTDCECAVCNCVQCQDRLKWKPKLLKKHFGQLRLKAQSPEECKRGTISYVTYENT